MAELACCVPTVSQVTGDEKTPLAYGLSQAGECWESFSPAWGGPGGCRDDRGALPSLLGFSVRFHLCAFKYAFSQEETAPRSPLLTF